MSERAWSNLLTAAGVIFLLVFCLGPIAFMAAVSGVERADFLAGDVPAQPTAQHYREVLTDPSVHFLDYLRNSAIISLVSAGVCVAIAAMAAYALTRMRFRGGRLILVVVLSVSMFPQIALAPYLYKALAGAGLINTYAALILPYVAWTLPLSLWILVSYFSQLPMDLDEAAMLDGCSRWRILTRILLPLAAPGVFSTFLLAFILAFNEFLFALMLTTDHRARTIPVGIALFQGLHGQTPWGSIMAASVLTTLPVVALTLLFQRRIVAGLTQGAVKE